MTEFSVFMPHQGITAGNSWLGNISLKDYKKYGKKNEGNKNKIILGETGMAEIKYKYFRDVIPIMPCQNSLWIMGLRIYGEGKTKIRLSSPTNTTIDPLAQDQK